VGNVPWRERDGRRPEELLNEPRRLSHNYSRPASQHHPLTSTSNVAGLQERATDSQFKYICEDWWVYIEKKSVFHLNGFPEKFCNKIENKYFLEKKFRLFDAQLNSL
jgi:hypothetical protein